jgi:hypothetical protein
MKQINKRREISGNDGIDECTFSPQLCYSTTYANGNIDDFLERQKIYNELRKDRLERKMSKSIENNQYTFKPKINLTSDFLVKLDPNRINENSFDKFERMSNFNYEKNLKKKIKMEESYYGQFEFKPKINEVSKYIGKENNLNDLSNNKKDYTSGKSKDFKSSKFKEINNINMKECTFNPKINRNKFENIQSNYKLDNNISNRINKEIKYKSEKVEGLKK